MNKIAFVLGVLIASPPASGIAQTCPPAVVKVPCRDMGDGRTLIDSLYLPDTFVMGQSRYTIIHTGPVSMQGEWANHVCTVRLN